MMRILLGACLLTLGLPLALAQQAADPAPARSGEPALEAMPLAPGSDALTSSAEDRLSLAIRVPVDGPALVVEQREIALLAGRNQIRIRDLPAAVTDPGLHWQLDGMAGPRRLSRAGSGAWTTTLFAETGGSRQLTLSYAVDGLERELDYRIVLPAAGSADSARVTAAMTLTNRSGADLGGADLSVVRNDGTTTRIATGPQWPDQGRLRLRPGPGASVSLERSLITTARGDLPLASAYLAPVRHHIALGDLPVPPAPDTRATLLGAGNPARPLGTARLVPGANGGTTLIGGRSDALSVRRVQAAYRHGTEGGIDIAWRIEVHNRSGQRQRLHLVEQIDGGWRVEAGEDDWQRTPTGLQREIELAADERRELGYRIRLQR